MRGRVKGGAMLVALLLAGCSAAAAPVVPSNPPEVVTPEEYSFGSDVQSRDWRATRVMLDALEARFGEKSMRLLSRNLPADANPAAIRSHYAASLPDWRFEDLGADYRKQSWSFVLVSPDGRKALAVVALLPDAVVNSGWVPFNILTNLDE